MRLTDIKLVECFQNIPEAGMILAYTSKKVVFCKYSNIDDLDTIIGDNDLLELHLFNDTKEFRCLKTDSPRFKQGLIAYIEDSKIESDLDYYLENGIICEDDDYNKVFINVLNHISYDVENGMASVDSYRMTVGGAK